MGKSTALSDSVIIVGGGIGGLAAAVACTKVGIPVVVLEKGHALRQEGASINIGTNGWRAMDALGVANSLRHKFVALESVTAMREDGTLLKQLRVADCAYGPHEIRGCIRNDLVKALGDALPEGTIRFGAGVASIRTIEQGAEVVLENGDTYTGKVVVGADGSYSKVKAAIGGKPVEYSGSVSYRGLATFEEGLPQYVPGSRFILSGKGVIVGTYPLDTKRAYYFCGFPALPEEIDELRKGDMKADLLRRVKGFACNMEAMVEHTPADHIFLNRIGDRLVEAGETWGKGVITLIGDSAHPTTPALGQGGCMALEDGVELGAALRDATVAAGVSWADVLAVAIENALRDFERRRSTRCAPLIAKARRNIRAFRAPTSFWGVWLRDFMFKRYAYDPARQFNHTVWDSPSLDKPSLS